MTSSGSTRPARGRSGAVRRREVPDPGAGPQPTGVPDDARHARRTHDYVRHGTTSLFAAFDISDGTVITALHRRHRAIEFRKFLATIDAQVPDYLDIHLVCDNYGTHKAPTVQSWLASTRASTCTTRQPIPAGSTKWNDGSPNSPANSSNAATTAACRPSKRTSAPGSPPGTTIPNRSSGPRPPSTSSSPSNN